MKSQDFDYYRQKAAEERAKVAPFWYLVPVAWVIVVVAALMVVVDSPTLQTSLQAELLSEPGEALSMRVPESADTLPVPPASSVFTGHSYSPEEQAPSF
jgi:hypothetical protein